MKTKDRIAALERLVASHEEQLQRICTCPRGTVGNREADHPGCPIHGHTVFIIPNGTSSTSLPPWCTTCGTLHIPGMGACTATYS